MNCASHTAAWPPPAPRRQSTRGAGESSRRAARRTRAAPGRTKTRAVKRDSGRAPAHSTGLRQCRLCWKKSQFSPVTSLGGLTGRLTGKGGIQGPRLASRHSSPIKAAGKPYPATRYAPQPGIFAADCGMVRRLQNLLGRRMFLPESLRLLRLDDESGKASGRRRVIPTPALQPSIR